MVPKSILFLCLLLGAAHLQLARAENKVLVVHSYHEAYGWTSEINNAILSVLKTGHVPYRVYYMDTKRKSGEGWKQESARQAKQLVRTYRPKVVIAVDDNAQNYFAKDYANRSPIQFVFCGVNADEGKYGYPAANVTGILERTYPGQTLRVLQTILPSIHKVAVVSDASATSDLVFPRIRKVMQKKIPGLQIVRYDQPIAFSDWKKLILTLDRDRQIDALMVPLYHTVRQNGTGVSVESADVMRWTLDHTRKPVVGLWPQIINDGGLLAVTVDPQEHGRVAAGMAMAILQGRTAEDIPIRINQDGKVLVNLTDKNHLPFDVSVNIDQVADEIIR